MMIFGAYLMIGFVFTAWTFAWGVGDYKGPMSAFLIMPLIWPYQLYLQLKYKGIL